MKMSKNFKQYNTEWAKLGYPKKPWYIKDCGCGEVAIANSITEMVDYASETPKTIQPWCKQYAAPNGDGTYWSAPPIMMAHYGMTECQEHQTMAPLWKELAKGNRVAIYLMSNRKAGSKKIKWTGSKHFICSTNYRYDEKTGKHWVYVKDSNSTSESRNGWLAYEDNLRNAVYKVWSGKLIIPYVPSTPYTGTLPNGTVKKGSKGSDVKAVQNFLNWCINAKLSVDGDFGNATDKATRKYQTQYKLKVDGVFGAQSKKKAQEIIDKYAPPKVQTPQDKMLAWAKDIANSKYHYVKWQEKVTATHTCPICTGRKYDNYYGWNCIGYAWASWHHSGLASKCNCHVFTDADYEKLLKVSEAEALKMAKSKIGLNDVKLYRNKNGLDINKLKPGTIIAFFSGNNYVHTAIVVGGGKIADCTSARSDGIKYGVNPSTKWKIKLAFEYTGK